MKRLHYFFFLVILPIIIGCESKPRNHAELIVPTSKSQVAVKIKISEEDANLAQRFWELTNNRWGNPGGSWTPRKGGAFAFDTLFQPLVIFPMILEIKGDRLQYAKSIHLCLFIDPQSKICWVDQVKERIFEGRIYENHFDNFSLKAYKEHGDLHIITLATGDTVNLSKWLRDNYAKYKEEWK